MITKDDSKNCIWLAYCDLRADYHHLSQECDQLKEKLEIATGALNHYLYGGSNYSQIARDALEEIKGDQHETNT